jgi:NO-binding membrane sensor protein with MHYT domain
LLAANNFSFGVLTPVLGYVMSCLGAFIGLRCTTRAYAYTGAARARWLALAAISIGTTGCWVMHFIGMLGYTIPGMTIRYNVPITIGSMIIAVVVVAIGLFIVGFGKPTWPNLLIAGTFTGIGVASMHYTGMAALEIPATMSYQSGLFALSVVIGIGAATAALWAALRLRGLWSTLGASLIMGVAVSGMHYTGMAAMDIRRPTGPVMAATGATAEGFLLPLIIGIGVVSIIMTGVLVFSPTESEIREDQELMQRINEATSRLASAPSLPTTPGPTARWNGAAPRSGYSGPSGYSGQNGYTGQNGTSGAPGAGPAGAPQQDLSRRHRRIGRVSRPEEPDQRLVAREAELGRLSWPSEQ